MLDVLNLALPFFGLILIGFAAGKLRRIPDAGLAWMSWFIIYAALPALFYRLILAQQYDSWVAQASGAVLFGTLASVVTLTTVLWLVKTQALPLPLIH